MKLSRSITIVHQGLKMSTFVPGSKNMTKKTLQCSETQLQPQTHQKMIIFAT